MGPQTPPSDGLLADIGYDNARDGRGLPPRRLIVRQHEMPGVRSMYVVLDHQLAATYEDGLSMRFVKVQSGGELEFLPRRQSDIFAVRYSCFQFFEGDGYVHRVFPQVLTLTHRLARFGAGALR